MFQFNGERKRVHPLLAFSAALHATLLFIWISGSLQDLTLPPITTFSPIEPPVIIVFDPDVPPLLQATPRPQPSPSSGSAPAMNPEIAEPENVAPEGPETNEAVTVPVPEDDDDTNNSGDSGPFSFSKHEGDGSPGPRDSNTGKSGDGGTGNGGGDSGGDGIYGEWTVEIVHPVLIHRVEPLYPELCRKLRIQGPVIIRAVVGKDGLLSELNVLRSPHPLLQNEALRAVGQWRYTPPRIGTRPVRCYITITVNYVLR